MSLHTRIRGTLLGGISLTLATLIVAGAAHASPTPRATSAAVTTDVCTLKTFDLTPTAIRGEDFGVLKCPRWLGPGVQHNTSILTPTSATTGTLKGASTLYFSRGTVRSRFTLRYTISGRTITFSGTAKVTGGTGAFKRITGSAKLAGSSQDGGSHSTITERIRVRRP
jgi:hypothetical protein